MTTPFWDTTAYADRRGLLLARNRIKQAMRRWFEADDFEETECAILQGSPGNEAHLHAFASDAIGADGARRRVYLHTSPEFAMKKLLAAGEDKLFEFARVFRNRESGPLHAREFTMLEWYRAERPYEVAIADTAALIALAAETVGAEALRWRDASCDPFKPYERITVAEAFRRHARVDLLETLSDHGAPDRAALAAQTEAIGLDAREDDDWSDLFARILTARVEPALGRGALCVLDEYPAVEAALARKKPSDPRVAERFEVYACGVELANGFGELTDPLEQRARFEAEMALKEARYGERYPLDEDFLAALAQMPPASGVAMGFDRVVMVCLAAPNIEAVQWTPER